MATRQNLKELGWMYTAPSKPRVAIEQDYEAMSQIPGLNELPPVETDDGQRGWIKESDSKYIRLAKQGGRADLLQFPDPKPLSNEAKGYPRCEWFYQEDNSHEEHEKGTQEDSEYIFKLPEYMVHDTFQGNPEQGDHFSESFRPSRLPYAIDTTTIYERDGNHVTDKRVRIPETTKPGYGVRSGKPAAKVTYAPDPRSSAKSESSRRRPVEPSGEDKTTMTKIIAGTYEKQWYDALQEKLDDEHKRDHKPKKTGADVKPNISRKADTGTKTEYQEVFAVATKDSRRPKHGRRAQQSDGGSGVDLKQDMLDIKKLEKDAENLFKLSKFKNVPAKIDTNIHRSNEINMNAS